METKKCQECGTENPMSRVTCVNEKCHAKLLRADQTKKEGQELVSPVKGGKRRERKESGKTETAEAPPAAPPEPETAAPVVKRRRRRSVKTPVLPSHSITIEGKTSVVFKCACGWSTKCGDVETGGMDAIRQVMIHLAGTMT